MLLVNNGRGRQKKANSASNTTQWPETTRCLRSTEKLPRASEILSDQVEVQEVKKLSEQPKKRPGRQQQSTATLTRKRKIEKDAVELVDYSLATARSKRAPKPNPKYAAEQIITSQGKSVRKINKIFTERISRERAANIREKAERQQSLLNESKSERQIASVVSTQALVQSGLDDFTAMVVSDVTKPVEAAEKLNKDKEMRKRKLFAAINNKQLQLPKEKIAAADAERKKQKHKKEAAEASLSESGRSPARKYNVCARQPRPKLIAHMATLDDAKTMPTFSIVNINDIINKKEWGDISNDPAAQSQNNRRKTRHTASLLDKIDTSTRQRAIQTRATSPQRIAIKIRNSLPADISIDRTKESPLILKAQKSKSTSSLLQAAHDDESEVVGNTIENNASPAFANNQRNLIQMQESVLVKKITSAVWYILKNPVTSAPRVKYVLKIPLTRLGNNIKDIQLPSEDWSYHITLRKRDQNLSPSTEEIYVGEIHQEYIREDQRQDYVPISITFRRRNTNMKVRLLFDRSIIFKQNEFLINMNGNRIELLGAPQFIDSLSDIQTLLEILDEIDEKNDFVQRI